MSDGKLYSKVAEVIAAMVGVPASRDGGAGMSDGKLYSKVAEVIAELGYVAKDGTNQFQNYKYTSAEAFLAAVRGPLSERGVVVMPSLTSVSEREYTTSKGKASVITTAHVKFTLVDGESGQSHECEWAGQGDDPADKGLGKAFTNAIKTYLREQFLIPTGDDPEADASTDERAQDRAPTRNGNPQPQPEAEKPKPGERPVNDRQRTMLEAQAREHNLTPGQFANVILLAAGEDERVWSSPDVAARTLGMLLDRLPADLVTAVKEGIAR